MTFFHAFQLSIASSSPPLSRRRRGNNTLKKQHSQIINNLRLNLFRTLQISLASIAPPTPFINWSASLSELSWVRKRALSPFRLTSGLIVIIHSRLLTSSSPAGPDGNTRFPSHLCPILSLPQGSRSRCRCQYHRSAWLSSALRSTSSIGAASLIMCFGVAPKDSYSELHIVHPMRRSSYDRDPFGRRAQLLLRRQLLFAQL